MVHLLLIFLPAAVAFVPNWKPTYNMSMSTIFMPCNMSGMFDATIAAKWGVVDFDWSNEKQLWANAKPMDCQERLITQAAMVKAVNPATKVFVYRNLVKALPWYTQVREKLDDPNYSGWFLKFKDGINGTYRVPPCTGDKCSVFYHDQDQTPEHPRGDGSCVDECDCGANPCGEYLWDPRNSSLREWIVSDFVSNPQTGIGNPNVDGFYLDDGWTNVSQPPASWWPKEGFCSGDVIGGPTEEMANCTVDMGLTQADTTDIHDAWTTMIAATNTAVLQANGFTWPMFAGITPPIQSECHSFFERECGDNPALYKAALQLEFTSPKSRPLPQLTEDLATFLLVRGDYAWIGYSWIGCSSEARPDTPSGLYYRPAELDLDYGVPQGTCTQEGSVFKRSYSNADVLFDCDSYKASITMH